MNGSMAFDAPEKRSDLFLTLTTVHRMLPLVQRIVADIQAGQKRLGELLQEAERLERNRRSLAWPQRQRRYQLNEELASLERQLQEALVELQTLGVALLEPEEGRVGFPTLVNNKPAFFSWKPGEDGLRSWHFAEEKVCRPIPPAWLKEIKQPVGS